LIYKKHPVEEENGAENNAHMMPLLWKSLVVVILAPLGCAFLLMDRSLAGQIIEREIFIKHQSGGLNRENPQKVARNMAKKVF